MAKATGAAAGAAVAVGPVLAALGAEWWSEVLVALLLGAALATLILSRPKRATRDSATQTDERTSRDVQSQSPTTFTAVRGSANPRFHPLPDHAHG